VGGYTWTATFTGDENAGNVPPLGVADTSALGGLDALNDAGPLPHHVAAALEAESTADLAVVDAVSAAERALPVRASVKLRKLFNNLLNTPASVGFFGISRSSFGCNAMMNILWRRVRSCVLIGMAVR
jgi:hypothetical protein